VVFGPLRDVVDRPADRGRAVVDLPVVDERFGVGAAGASSGSESAASSNSAVSVSAAWAGTTWVTGPIVVTCGIGLTGALARTIAGRRVGAAGVAIGLGAGP
jgi:hypothetical protein